MYKWNVSKSVGLWTISVASKQAQLVVMRQEILGLPLPDENLPEELVVGIFTMTLELKHQGEEKEELNVQWDPEPCFGVYTLMGSQDFWNDGPNCGGPPSIYELINEIDEEAERAELFEQEKSRKLEFNSARWNYRGGTYYYDPNPTIIHLNNFHPSLIPQIEHLLSGGLHYD